MEKKRTSGGYEFMYRRFANHLGVSKKWIRWLSGSSKLGPRSTTATPMKATFMPTEKSRVISNASILLVKSKDFYAQSLGTEKLQPKI